MVVENQRLIKQPSCIIRKQRCGNKAKKLALILIPRFIVLETGKGRIIRIDRFFVIYFAFHPATGLQIAECPLFYF